MNHVITLSRGSHCAIRIYILPLLQPCLLPTEVYHHPARLLYLNTCCALEDVIASVIDAGSRAELGRRGAPASVSYRQWFVHAFQ